MSETATLRDRLQQLIDKWTRLRSTVTANPSALTYGFCADDLAALLAAPLPLRSEKEEDAIARLRKWREWAQFVFKDGGPATGTDDELRAAICARADAIERERR